MKALSNYIPKREFRRFVLVGGLGFCIDGGILTALMKYGWDVIPARCCSFFMAVSATWLLNRLWTFDTAKRVSIRKEYTYYFGVQVMGAAINLSIFFTLIGIYPLLRGIPLIPLAIGAVVSLVFNYLISRIYIFRG